MLNAVILNGRLASDVELRYSQSGTAFGNVTLAVQRNFKNKQTGEYETDFIRLLLLGKTAENFANFFHKGNFLGIQGSIQTGSYEKNGQKVYTTDVLVERFYFLETKSQNSNRPKRDPFSNSGNQIDISDDNLPF